MNARTLSEIPEILKEVEVMKRMKQNPLKVIINHYDDWIEANWHEVRLNNYYVNERSFEIFNDKYYMMILDFIRYILKAIKENIRPKRIFKNKKEEFTRSFLDLVERMEQGSRRALLNAEKPKEFIQELTNLYYYFREMIAPFRNKNYYLVTR